MNPNDNDIGAAVAHMLCTKDTWLKELKINANMFDYMTVDYSIVTTPEAIHELEELINKPKMDKLNTQAASLQAVKSRQFLICSVDSSGMFSMSPNPAAQDSVAAARTEAKRLARLSPGKAFVILQLYGAEMVPVQTISI